MSDGENGERNGNGAEISQQKPVMLQSLGQWAPPAAGPGFQPVHVIAAIYVGPNGPQPMWAGDAGKTRLAIASLFLQMAQMVLNDHAQAELAQQSPIEIARLMPRLQ